MAQGPMSSILVTFRTTVRIQESKVRNPDSLDYRLCWRLAEVCALWPLLVIYKYTGIATDASNFLQCIYGLLLRQSDVGTNDGLRRPAGTGQQTSGTR